MSVVSINLPNESVINKAKALDKVNKFQNDLDYKSAIKILPERLKLAVTRNEF